MAEIVSFASGKGGVGKTLLTAALGIFLSRKGKKVLLIDGDMGMRNMDLVLGLENECFYHVMDLAEGRCFAKDVILEVNDHLDFLPAAQNDTWETVFPAAMDTVLEDVEDKYDYILLDCPAGRGHPLCGASLGSYVPCRGAVLGLEAKCRASHDGTAQAIHDLCAGPVLPLGGYADLLDGYARDTR